MPSGPVKHHERVARRAYRAATREGFVVVAQEWLSDGTIRTLVAAPSNPQTIESRDDTPREEGTAA